MAYPTMFMLLVVVGHWFLGHYEVGKMDLTSGTKLGSRTSWQKGR